MHHPETDHAPAKAEQVGVLVHECPIEPADLVILAVCVVVAFLCTPYLVASHKHGDAAREQKDRHKVAHLTVAERLDAGIAGITLRATVPAEVIVDAVSV